MMIVAAWTSGPIFRQAVIISTSTVTEDGLCIRNRKWPNDFWMTFTNVVTFVVYFLFPILCISLLYISIFVTLRKRSDSEHLGEGNRPVSRIMHQATMNALKTLIMVTALFFLCWVWNMTLLFLFTSGVNLSGVGVFYNFSVIMTTVNCCVNPFCYAVQYREFQSQIGHLCGRKKPMTEADRATSVSTIQ